MILGGLLAGLVINICEAIVEGIVLADQWDASMKSLHRAAAGPGAIAAFWLWGFLAGIFALWLSATLRPRMGPGPKPAAFAGIAVWILASLLASVAPFALHLFPYHVMLHGIVVGLVEMVLGTIIGAWLYQEPTGA